MWSFAEKNKIIKGAQASRAAKRLDIKRVDLPVGFYFYF
jgi:hypothetical protein